LLVSTWGSGVDSGWAGVLCVVMVILGLAPNLARKATRYCMKPWPDADAFTSDHNQLADAAAKAAVSRRRALTWMSKAPLRSGEGASTIMR
jgi:hypothetical protein